MVKHSGLSTKEALTDQSTSSQTGNVAPSVSDD